MISAEAKQGRIYEELLPKTDDGTSPEGEVIS